MSEKSKTKGKKVRNKRTTKKLTLKDDEEDKMNGRETKRMRVNSNVKDVIDLNMSNFFEHETFEVVVQPMAEAGIVRVVNSNLPEAIAGQPAVQEAVERYAESAAGLLSEENSPFTMRYDVGMLTNPQRFVPNKDSGNLYMHSLMPFITGEGATSGKSAPTIPASASETRKQLDVLFKYHDQILAPAMQPFIDTQEKLVDQSVVPSQEQVCDYMLMFKQTLEREHNIAFACDEPMNALLEMWAKYTEGSRKKKERTVADMLRAKDHEILKNTFLTTAEFERFRTLRVEHPRFILSTDFGIMDVNNQGVFFLKEELSRRDLPDDFYQSRYYSNGVRETEIPLGQRACKNPECRVLSLFAGYNSNTAMIQYNRKLQMPRQRSAMNLSNDTWYDRDGIYDHCWVCNFLHSWIHMVLQLVKKNPKFVENGLFTVKLADQDQRNGFPADCCISHTHVLFTQVKNFFGHVLSPKTVFRCFHVMERNDGKVMLTFAMPGFQHG